MEFVSDLAGVICGGFVVSKIDWVGKNKGTACVIGCGVHQRIEGKDSFCEGLRLSN